MKKICEFCGNKIRKLITHINIESIPSTRYFCSKQCKFRWIFLLKELNKRIYKTNKGVD